MQHQETLLFCAQHESMLEEAAQSCLKTFPDVRIWLLNGQLGAGKTAFVKAFCKVLGVKDDVSSPTFGLVNEYEGLNNVVVFHFDLYRVEQQIDLFRIGIEEYLDSNSFCFFEWSDLVESLLSASFCKIDITIGENFSRNINVTKYGEPTI